MLAWIAMVGLIIFLGACAVVVATSCYKLVKLIFRFQGNRKTLLGTRVRAGY